VQYVDDDVAPLLVLGPSGQVRVGEVGRGLEVDLRQVNRPEHRRQQRQVRERAVAIDEVRELEVLHRLRHRRQAEHVGEGVVRDGAGQRRAGEHGLPALGRDERQVDERKPAERLEVLRGQADVDEAHIRQPRPHDARAAEAGRAAEPGGAAEAGHAAEPGRPAEARCAAEARHAAEPGQAFRRGRPAEAGESVDRPGRLEAAGGVDEVEVVEPAPLEDGRERDPAAGQHTCGALYGADGGRGRLEEEARRELRGVVLGIGDGRREDVPGLDRPEVGRVEAHGSSSG
jgi:hypothetical protein